MPKLCPRCQSPVPRHSHALQRFCGDECRILFYRKAQTTRTPVVTVDNLQLGTIWQDRFSGRRFEVMGLQQTGTRPGDAIFAVVLVATGNGAIWDGTVSEFLEKFERCE